MEGQLPVPVENDEYFDESDCDCDCECDCSDNSMSEGSNFEDDNSMDEDLDEDLDEDSDEDSDEDLDEDSDEDSDEDEDLDEAEFNNSADLLRASLECEESKTIIEIINAIIEEWNQAQDEQREIIKNMFTEINYDEKNSVGFMSGAAVNKTHFELAFDKGDFDTFKAFLQFFSIIPDLAYHPTKSGLLPLAYVCASIELKTSVSSNEFSMLRELIGLSGSEINEISDAFDFVGNEYHCYNGMTPLMIAAKRNRNDLVTELLVNQQIDKNVQNEKGQKALDFANDQTLRDLFGLNQNK